MSGSTACGTRSGRGGSQRSRTPTGALDGTYPDQVRIKTVRSAAFTGDLAAVGLQRCRPPFDASGGTRGFALYDVSRPARPRLLSIVNTLPVVGSHELWLQAVGDRAYVYTAIPRAELRGSPDGITPANPDFRIYDVSDPTHPVQVGQWGIWANLGIKPTFNQFVHSVITNAAATRAYLSYWEYGTVILDISDPSRPQHVSTLRDPAQLELPHAHSAWLTPDEKVLLETQEFGRFFNFNGTGYPRLFDLSDERNPALIGRYVLPGAETSTATIRRSSAGARTCPGTTSECACSTSRAPARRARWRTSNRGPDGTRRTRGAPTARSSGEPSRTATTSSPPT